MARVLLVQPHEDRTNEYNRRRINTPINLIVVGTAIEDKHEVKIYDRNLDIDDEKFVRFLKKYNPDIVGFTAMTSPMLFDLVHTGKIVKKISPEVIVIVGGIHAQIDPDSLLNEPYVDYIIQGEADETFLEFCDDFDKNPKKLGKLKNINHNPLRPFVDMEKLKAPNYELVDLKKYGHVFVMLSRGCPGNCTFCSSTRRWGKGGIPCVREYRVEEVLKMFRNLIEKNGIKVFSIADDNFVSYADKTKKICDYLKDKKVHFFSFARADYVNDQTLKMLRKAGCHTIQIGIESGSQRVLNFLNKRTTIQQNIEAIRCCKRNGITCDASFMLGVPSETVEELNETVRFIKKHKPASTNAKIFNPFPGTPIFDYCINKGLIKKESLPKTLEEWARWTGDVKLIKIEHNVSEIPSEYLFKVAQELLSYGFYKHKIKRLFYWLKAGEIKLIIKNMRNVFIHRGSLILPFRKRTN